MSPESGDSDFLKITIRRALGIRFFCSILLITFVLFLDTEPSVRSVLLGKYLPQEHQSIAYYLGNTLRYGVNYKLFLVFMTMGYAVDIPLDWKHKVVPAVVQKLGVNGYSRIQIGVAALSGGLAVVGGFLIYLVVLRTKLPVIASGEGMAQMNEFLMGMPYHRGISPEDIRFFIVCMTAILFLSGVVGTAIAASLSVYLNNVYIVLVTPYLLLRVYIECANVFRIPEELRMDRWFAGMIQPFSIPMCLIILSAVSLILVLLSKKLFVIGLKWRLENG